MNLFPNGYKNGTIDGFSSTEKAANLSNFRPQFTVPGEQQRQDSD